MERNQDSSGRDTREQGLFELVLKGGRVIDPDPKIRSIGGCRVCTGAGGGGGARYSGFTSDICHRCHRADCDRGTDRSAHPRLLGRHFDRHRCRCYSQAQRHHHIRRCGQRRRGQFSRFQKARDGARSHTHPRLHQHLLRRHLRLLEECDGRRKYRHPPVRPEGSRSLCQGPSRPNSSASRCGSGESRAVPTAQVPSMRRWKPPTGYRCRS